MTNSSREKKIRANQEGHTNDCKLTKSSTSSSREWAGFKNPRIVSVSRSFGGKDRHSKVCTIRGVRDRRIRLSVPIAIQLYDLQDRLGISQPSKVVDWLLDVTKHEIDKLPPLQMPPQDFSQFHQPTTLVPQELIAPQSSLSPFFNINSEFMKDRGTQLFTKEEMNSDAASRGKCKEVERENSNVENNKWITTNEQENQGGNGNYIAQLSAQNFFPLASQFSFPGLLNNTMPYNWEPNSNLSLSQFGSQGFPSQADSNSTTQSLSLPSPQLLFYPPATTPSFFPQYPPFMTSSIESDPRQINHFQFLSSSSQHIVPNSLMSPLHFISPLNVNPKVHPQNNNDSQPNKGNSGS